MKKYIVITTGGFTLDDNNIEVNNMQVVCLCLAMNKSDAINRAQACADSMEHDLERIKVPYVIGQTGWHKGSRPKPINKRFFHCTDYKKVAAYCACLYHLSGGTWLSHIDDEIFIELTNKYGFFYPEQYKARVRELATTK